MENATMDALFNPQTIAMVGATADSAKIGYRIAHNIIAGGFGGRLFLINPKGGRILNRDVLTSVDELPEGVDLVFLAIPQRAVFATVQACIRRKVRYVVALTAGFKETGAAGEQLERDLRQLVKSSTTRLVGPNCAGLSNSKVHFHGSMEMAPPKGRIAFVSQSGSLCSAFSSTMAGRGGGLSKYISIGNKMDVDVADILTYLGQDAETDCIALYLEDIPEGRRLFETAVGVSRQKPIVVLKSGRTGEGARATLSHTGAMAGEDRVADGALRQMGMIRVDGLSQLFDVAATISQIGPLGGNNIAVLSDAGGPGVLATDALVGQKLKVPRPSPEAQQQLRSHLEGFASVRNPVDMTFTRDAGLYARCAEILVADGMDAVLITIPSHFSIKTEIVDVLSRLKARHNLPLVVAWLSADEVEAERRTLWRKGIPCFLSPEQAAYALGCSARYGRWLKRP